MSIQTAIHINFRGQAREALAFYQSVFGGELVVVTHEQSYGTTDPAEKDLVGWGQVMSVAGFNVQAYDVPAKLNWNAGEIPYFVSVRGPDAAELTGYWEKLVDGGTIVAPLGASGWSSLYGMVKDRFGVTWVLNVPAYPAG